MWAGRVSSPGIRSPGKDRLPLGLEMSPLKAVSVSCVFALSWGCRGGGEVPRGPGSRNEALRAKVDELKSLREMPYYPELSGDKLFWEVVKEGRDAIPLLIDKIDDGTTTEAVVPLVGGNYVVGDIAIHVLMEMVRGIPIVSCVGGSVEHGFMDYWSFVREGARNRRVLEERVRRWYGRHGGGLGWEADDMLYQTARNWPYQDRHHPAGGHYVVPEGPCE